MRRWFHDVDSLLRGGFTGSEELAEGRLRVPASKLAVIGLLMGAIYGVFMGMYGVLRPGNPSLAQLAATMIKVPVLFLLTLGVTFPSLYVFSALANSRLRFHDTLKLLLAAVAVNLALLASFGPVTGFFTLSTESYPFMVVLNVLVFALAGFVALAFLRRVLNVVFAPPRKEPPPEQDVVEESAELLQVRMRRATPSPSHRHQRIFIVWMLIYGVVGAQMGWILRPFIGTPNMPFTPFRQRESNFFEAFFDHLGRLFVQEPWVIASVDGLLRAEGRFAVGTGHVPLREIAVVLAICGFVYGAAMGSFSVRALQSVFSGIKVPLLLVVATLICLPSFFAVNAVLGLRDDFAAAIRGILAAQGTVAICLAGLAPVTVLSYLSSSNYRFAIVINGLYFLLAALAGQLTLQRHYRPLVARNPRHRIARSTWIVLYVFVAIQLAWVLRPFVGAPNMETRFFREDAWSNAYVVVLNTVWELFAGR